ncbi:MAG: CHAT domain-containing protein [Flavobacteriales bacterium]
MKRTFIIPSGITVNSSEKKYDHFEKSEVEKASTSRGDRNASKVEVDQQDIVEMELEDGSVWIGPALELPKYFDENPADLKPRSANELNDFVIPEGIKDASSKRGDAGKFLLKALSFFKKKAAQKVTSIIVRETARKFDNKQQPDPGLYSVSPEFKLTRVKDNLKPEADKPYVLFIHGTASNFEGSFGKIPDGGENELNKFVKDNYGNRMLAFEHYTLSETPFDNACDLINQLPDNIKLHIVSHSRGGLIGELLCLFHSGNSGVGFNDVHLEALRKVDAYKEGLDKLVDAVKKKKIHVERFVRVACPASGTHLCSERLDRVINILLNSVKYLAPPSAIVVDILKELIADILACKEDSNILPGLEVMSPLSTFQSVLNAPDIRIDAPLSVIQGNAKIGLSFRSIITLLSKVVFLEKNDWIVDTASMTFGARRSFEVGVFFQEGEEVNHFSYFLNDPTRNAIAKGLAARNGEIPVGFNALNMAMNRSAKRGVIMGSYFHDKVTGNRPVVVILPGILGSNLSRGEEEIYLNLGRLSLGGMKALSIDAPNVKAKTIIGDAYRQLGDYLNSKYDVVTFPYDWRKSINGESDILAERLTEIMNAAPGQPIKIVAHSMGGVLARHIIIKHKNVWERLQSHDGFRLLFLGTPLGGSYLIPEVLIGYGKRIQQMSKLDFTSTTEELLSVFSRYEGLLNLLPVQAGPHDFTQESLWKEMRKHAARYNWPVADLSEFKKFREEVLALDTSVYQNKNIVYVAGKSDQTTDSFFYDPNEEEGKQLTFTYTEEGDGSVTWKTGIPAEIKNSNRLYYVATGHGALAKDDKLFDGIDDILAKGYTSRFSAQPVALKKGLFKKLFGRGVSPVSNESELADVLLDSELGFDDWASDAPAINVRLTCGDMIYARHPIMIGHLAYDALWGPEDVLDRFLDHALSKRVNLGVYPDMVGTSSIFEKNGKARAVVVGLGSAEEINSSRIEKAVSQAVIKYVLHLQDNALSNGTGLSKVGLSMILMGSGYIGLSVQQALQTTITGVNKANEALRSRGIETGLVEELEFIEIFEDKAIQAFHDLKRMQTRFPLGYVFEQTHLNEADGKRLRMILDNHEEWWMRMSITRMKDSSRNKLASPLTRLKYTASQNLARAEVFRMSLSADLLEPILREMSIDHRWSADLAMTLYTKLIPYDFRDNFVSQQNIQLLLDDYTAQFPWELMQDTTVQSDPLITKIGFVRQLTTERYRERVIYPADNSILIIGDPDLEGWDMFDQLPGARQEAELVTQMFAGQAYEVTSLINSDSNEITKKISPWPHRIIHIAAHGHYDLNNVNMRGLVIGKEKFMRTNDITALNYVPEMIFVNACYLGQMNEEAERISEERYRLAANIGTELIKMGVKAVVVAGWAVDDAAALYFAEIFYKEMFSGATFSDALREARSACYNKFRNSNTWGAYQGYGNQQYRLSNKAWSSKNDDGQTLLEPQIELELRNLASSKTNNGDTPSSNTLNRVKWIEQWLERHQSSNAKLYELIGLVYFNLKCKPEALNAFQKMKSCSEASFSVSSLEKYCITRRKLVNENNGDIESMEELISIATDLKMLSHIAKTAERSSLLGGTYKAIFTVAELVHKQTGDKKLLAAMSDALNEAARHYREATELCSQNSAERAYPLVNALVLEKALRKQSIERTARNTIKPSAEDREALNEIKELFDQIDDVLRFPKDYWERMYPSNRALFELLVYPDDKHRAQFVKGLNEVWDIDGSPNDRGVEMENLGFLRNLFSFSPDICKALLDAHNDLLSVKR